MLIVIVRHAKAEDRAPSGADRDRRLVKRGEVQARWLATALAERLAGRGESPGVILTSDYTRALATARSLAAAVGWPLHEEAALRVGRDPEAAADAVLAQGVRPVLLVGHNPQFSELLAWLLPAGETGGDLRTGEAALVEGEPDRLKRGCRLVERIRLED